MAEQPIEQTQFIRIYDDPDQRHVILNNYPWPDDQGWPPPQRLGLLIGKGSGEPHMALTDPQGETEVREHVAAQGTDFDKWFSVVWFTQASCSQISDEDAAEMPHVAHCASYIPEEVAGG